MLFFSEIIQSHVLCCSGSNAQLLAGSKTPLGEVDPSIEEGGKKSRLAQGESFENKEIAQLFSKM